MSTEAAPPESESTTDSLELPEIEFDSPGRFSIHNPPTSKPRANAPSAFALPADSNQSLSFSGVSEAQSHILALIQHARRSLCIASFDLSPTLYDHAAIAKACNDFLLQSPRANLRILLQDSTLLIKHGHALLALSRKLSSRMTIKLLNLQASEPLGDMLLSDDRALLWLPERGQLHGQAHYNAPVQVRRQTLAFNQAWELSLADPNLRSFLL